MVFPNSDVIRKFGPSEPPPPLKWPTEQSPPDYVSYLELISIQTDDLSTSASSVWMPSLLSEMITWCQK